MIFHFEWYIRNVLVCAHFSSKQAHGTYCLCSITQLFRLLGIQSNLSKPYPDKTEHLPKPNDFRGPEFFPYYSLLKTLNKP